MKLTDFTVLTLDCYGTLIDWETGIFEALLPLVTKTQTAMSRDQVLQIFAENEFGQQTETPAMPYPQLLSVVFRRLAKGWGIPVTNEEANTFGASVPDWPEFSDSVSALQYLRRHYKLIILSNVDRISFRASNARLQVAFDAVYTAQDIESYKPNPRNFEYLLRRLREDFGVEKSSVLHTAQSLSHDHAPANQIGLASAWIDRRQNETGWGATKAPARMPKFNFKFASMAALAHAHQEETAL